MLGQHCIDIMSSQYCPNTSEITLYKEITSAMLAQSAQTRFRRRITFAILSDLPVPTLHKKITCVMLNHSPRSTLHKKIIWNVILISVGQHCVMTLPVQCWTVVYKQLSWQNNLCNAVSIGIWQHCMGISYIQCCPNTSETTLHKKFTDAMLA